VAAVAAVADITATKAMTTVPAVMKGPTASRVLAVRSVPGVKSVRKTPAVMAMVVVLAATTTVLSVKVLPLQ
jgi:hypothetical protein